MVLYRSFFTVDMYSIQIARLMCNQDPCCYEYQMLLISKRSSFILFRLWCQLFTIEQENCGLRLLVILAKLSPYPPSTHLT